MSHVYYEKTFKCKQTNHDFDGSIKALDGVLKPLGLHVGFTQENEQRSYGSHTSGALKNFNGLKIKQIVINKIYRT